MSVWFIRPVSPCRIRRARASILAFRAVWAGKPQGGRLRPETSPLAHAVRRGCINLEGDCARVVGRPGNGVIGVSRGDPAAADTAVDNLMWHLKFNDSAFRTEETCRHLREYKLNLGKGGRREGFFPLFQCHIMNCVLWGHGRRYFNLACRKSRYSYKLLWTFARKYLLRKLMPSEEFAKPVATVLLFRYRYLSLIFYICHFCQIFTVTLLPLGQGQFCQYKWFMGSFYKKVSSGLLAVEKNRFREIVKCKEKTC